MHDIFDVSSLAGRVAAGDAQAETELATHFAPRIRAMALVRTRDADLARDLTQETLLAVLQALRKGQVRDAERIEAFIAGVTRNVINNHKRRRLRRPEVPLEDDAVAAAPDGEREDAERRRLLAGALALLSTSDRQVLLLTLVDGLKSGEIARRLGVSPDVARTRKSRALKRILEALDIRSRNDRDGHI